MLEDYKSYISSYLRINNLPENSSIIAPDRASLHLINEKASAPDSHTTPPVVSSTTVATSDSIITEPMEIEDDSPAVASTSNATINVDTKINESTSQKSDSLHKCLENKESKWIEARDTEGNVYYYHKDTR